MTTPRHPDGPDAPDASASSAERAGGIAAALATVAESLGGEITLDRLLPQIVSAARAATGARYGALGVLAEGRERIVHFIHEGMDPATVRSIGAPPTGKGVLGELIHRPSLIVSEDLGTHPSSVGFPANHPPMHTFLGLPVRAGGRIYGNLYLTEKAGGFDERDVDVVTVLSAVAGLAINAAQLAEVRRTIAVQDERDRISRDLHDGVIQVLFSIGMGLEGVRPLIGSDPDRVTQRVDQTIDQLDATIKEIRGTIFTLRSEQTSDTSLEKGLVELIDEYERNAELALSAEIGSSLDLHVSDDVVPDVLHIAREALSNAAKHAAPELVRVRAEVEHEVLVLEILDDGRGFDADTVVPGHGLGNMAERAALLGADLSITSEPDRGTAVQLAVPLTTEELP
ncbi:GAF domain-containing sensor histidine kinase [Euzebya sp.]|uniref:GAF domain-containing sensor histidine kinase n=1 Tax=Euzebya sp. TaxID=1971409 RepID=UPI003517BB88